MSISSGKTEGDADFIFAEEAASSGKLLTRQASDASALIISKILKKLRKYSDHIWLFRVIYRL